MIPEKRNFEFGPFRIDAVERLLFRGKETIPLTPKVADTLLALLANAGRIVDKDDLMKAIWRASRLPGQTRNAGRVPRGQPSAPESPWWFETFRRIPVSLRGGKKRSSGVMYPA